MWRDNNKNCYENENGDEKWKIIIMEVVMMCMRIECSFSFLNVTDQKRFKKWLRNRWKNR